MDFLRYRFSGMVSGIFAGVLFFLSMTGCSNHQNIQEKEVVESPEEINTKAEDLIQTTLEELLQNPARLPDSIKLKNAAILQEMYSKNSYGLLWSSEGVFNKEADSLTKLIDSARYYGLFPADYYAERLKALKTELNKSTSKETKLDAAKWAYADMLSTSAFIQLIKDIRFGRLLADSILVKDTTLKAGYFTEQKLQFIAGSIQRFTDPLEPANNDYHQLKMALHAFLPKANLKSYTLVRTKDSLLLPKLVYKRISEEDSLKIEPKKKPDSLAIAGIIKKYQKWKKLKEDGKISTSLVTRLNNTDKEKFIRIAITLDKFKMLPSLPEEYIWVNLPSYILEIRTGDSVALTS
ncbi:MAG: hypothetical protein EON98_05370, partial [Chitinophagaceae bacterium]